MIIKCPECGHQVSDRAKTCPSCGIDIAGKITRCPDCGEYIFKDEHECPNCHCCINASANPVVNDMVVAQFANVPEIPEIPSPAVAASPKKSHKGLWSAVILAFVLALIIVFLGIYFVHKTQQQNEQRAYENAMMSIEPAVLQNFLDMYIDASVAHRDSIKSHLEVLKKIDRDWENARISASKKELLLFVERNPGNIHVKEARLMVDSLDFVTAQTNHTMEAYKKYMEEHEQGYYYDEAKNEYDKMAEEAERIRQQAIQDSIQAAQQAEETAKLTGNP